MDSLFVKYLIWRETMSDDDPVAVMVRWCAFWTVFLFASWIVYELLTNPHEYRFRYSNRNYEFSSSGWIVCLGVGLLSAFGLPHILKAAVIAGSVMWLGMCLKIGFLIDQSAEGYDVIFIAFTVILTLKFYLFPSRLSSW